jgi:hypothetical protein
MKLPAGCSACCCSNAVQALEWGHREYPNMRDASAAAVKAGVDLFCDKADQVSWQCISYKYLSLHVLLVRVSMLWCSQ